jgi:hypothetical protein
MIVGSDLRKIDFFGFFVGAIQSVRPISLHFQLQDPAKELAVGSRWPTCLASRHQSDLDGNGRWLRSDPFRRSQSTMLHQLMVPQSLGLVRL